MRESERGFSLVEVVIAVAIAAVLLAAGGIWLGGMHPGALRNAADDFDAELGVARATAASSGNGATIAILPRIDAQGTHDGFTLRVYTGRPNAANAVRPANAMAVISSATVSEKTFGNPPFAIFLSSAGHPTGLASYPAVDAQGNPAFDVIAAQPPCPAGGIVLTFANAQGARETRTLQCSVSVAGTSVANPSPTPNVPVIVPKQMVAHWTSDNSALRFVAAEFGYTHWFASNTGTACGSSATYDAGWPYSNPPNPSEASLSPAPPSAPYSWPNAVSMNDAPASFAMSPVKGVPGLCTVDIVDDYGQHAGAAVQVMGDLTATPTSLTFASPSSPAQSIAFTKTYDGENITLRTTDNCRGIASYTQPGASNPGSPSTTPAQSTLSVSPLGGGQCDIRTGDQYGEPYVDVHVVVNNSVVQVWPPAVQYPTTGSALGTLAYDPGPMTPARFLNSIFGGGIAYAATPGCAFGQPRAFDGSGIWTSAHIITGSKWGVTTDGNGCITSPASIGVHETGYSGTFALLPSNCGPSLVDDGWTPASALGPTSAKLEAPASNANPGCTLTFADQLGVVPSPPPGKIANVLAQIGGCANVGDTCLITGVDSSVLTPSVYCDASFGDGGSVISGYTGNTSVTQTPALGIITTVSGGYSFTRTAPGTVTIHIYAEWKNLIAPGLKDATCKTTSKQNILMSSYSFS